MKRFLFIGHDATGTGAPIVLLHLLRWLRTHQPDWKIDLLLMRGGVLVSEYRTIADVFVIPAPDAKGRVSRGITRFKKALGLGADSSRSLVAPHFRSYDGVLGNTIVTLPELGFFKRKSMPTVCWIHELAYVANSFFPNGRFPKVAANADRFIAPSKAVEDFLRQCGISSTTNLVYEFSQPNNRAGVPAVSVNRSDFGIPAGAFLVVGRGTIEWRKGVDIFLQVATAVVRSCPDVYFIWEGGSVVGTEAEFDKIRFDLERLSLDGRVIFAGYVPDLSSVLREADLFALTSREDPFPLVCLDAAALSKPIICFAGAGGMPEFVEDDAGTVVPYGDIVAFRDAIIRYHRDRPALERAGRMAKTKVDKKFSMDASCEAIARILLEL